MSVLTILAYLFGSRSAIEHVVADDWAVLVGLALLPSAALARSYRAHDLRKQWWHLVLPFVAALTLALLLFASLGTGAPAWPRGPASLAALVLLTAPLAWLYAIPFERFLSWPWAVRARLLTLGVVATWRVALIVRAVAVLLDDNVGAALCRVLLVADAVALAALLVSSLLLSRRRKPARGLMTPMLLEMMSGVEATVTRTGEPGRDLLSRSAVAVAVAGVVTLPAWWIGMTRLGGPSAERWHRLVAERTLEAPSAGVWLLAGGALASFAVLLPWTQRAPRLRSRVEGMLMGGRAIEALRLMSAHRRSDFPPGWVPPPEDHFRDPPRLLDLVSAVVAEPCAEWVRAVYLGRFRAYLSDPLWYWFYDADLERIVGILQQLPEGPALARQVLDTIPAFEEKLKQQRLLPTSEWERGEWLRLRLHPENEPTGRREEVIAALERLAGRRDYGG
jgi:hypothetical protein